MQTEGNPHAQKIGTYAIQARSCKDPWKLWQTRLPGRQWVDCGHAPLWYPDKEYRLKPACDYKVFFGYRIPTPLTDPPTLRGTRYYVADPVKQWTPQDTGIEWRGTTRDYDALALGIAHETVDAAMKQSSILRELLLDQM